MRRAGWRKKNTQDLWKTPEMDLNQVNGDGKVGRLFRIFKVDNS